MFGAKLLTGTQISQESKTRVINLNGGKFSEEDIDGLLRFLYFEELDRRQEKDPIATFLVADYFQVAPLRARAEDELISKLNKLIQEGHFAKFKKYSHLVLSQYHDTDLEDIVTRVITDNIKTVMYDSGTWIELTDAYSSLARKVLGLIFPRPTAVTPAKRPASAAFDDTQNPSSPGSKKRHIRRKSGKN